MPQELGDFFAAADNRLGEPARGESFNACVLSTQQNNTAGELEVDAAAEQPV